MNEQTAYQRLREAAREQVEMRQRSEAYDELRAAVQKLAHRWDARSQGAARDVTEYNVMTTFRECAEQLQALIPGGDQGQDPEDDE